MRKFSFIRSLALGFGLFFAGVALAATYTQTVLTDGFNLWTFVSANSSASSPMALQHNGVTVTTFDAVNGTMVLSSLVGALPACTPAINGAVRFVTDNTGTTVGGTAAGSGSVQTVVVCYGTGAVWVVG
jgi:hypothetical protein